MKAKIQDRARAIPRTATISGAFIVLLASLACSTANEAGTRVGNPPTVESTTEAFPSNLALTSPLESGDDFAAAAGISAGAYLANGGPMQARAYALAVDSITRILEGDDIADCAFNPEPVLRLSADALCYGPNVPYENHPEALPDESDNGVLPPGDVGIWTENEEESGEACSAAELNNRMAGVEFKAQVALEALASLLCVINVDEDIDMPESGNEVTLTSEMNDMAGENGIDIEVSLATLGLGSEDGRDSYEYELEFSYTDNTGEPHAIVIRMSHVPLDDENDTYKGRFYFAVDREDANQQNCAGSSALTDAGSVLYNLSSATDLKILSDTASFCGSGVDAMTVVGDLEGLIDPANKFDAIDNPEGWGNTWTMVRANFDPTTNAGNYAFAWQAGAQDDFSRTFNITLAEQDTSSDDDGDDDDLAGTAFFGFGDDVEFSEGAIAGFICNWAGPGADHWSLGEGYEPAGFAQRQDVEQDVDGAFVSDSATLAITYAPTNACTYDGSGDFTYDSNGDGAVDTDPAVAVDNELLQLADADGDGIFDAFADSGFTLPEEPANF